MDMTVVIGIFTLFFFVTLGIMCFYRSKIKPHFWNKVFVIADFVAFSVWVYASYQRGWLRDGWPTLENISPLMFTVILLLPFMHERIKEYAYSALAALNVGMFIAMLVSPEHDYIFNFNTEATLAYTGEAVCHMLCSLFGIYLVLSHQVKPDFKHWVKSMIFLLPIITFGVILNFVYHKSNFGMDPYGSASIYMIDIFGSFWATLVAYYFGVVLVLTVGIQGAAMLDMVTARFFEHKHHNEVNADIQTTEIKEDGDEPLAQSLACEKSPGTNADGEAKEEKISEECFTAVQSETLSVGGENE